MTDQDPKPIPGLNRVTAISGPPQSNLDFRAAIPGQRLAQRSVNFDDPGTHHLCYGDARMHESERVLVAMDAAVATIVIPAARHDIIADDATWL